MAQVLRRMGLLFSETDNHVLCSYGCSRSGYCDRNRFICVFGFEVRVVSSMNVWRLIDGSLEVQMMYWEKKQRGTCIPGVFQR